MLIFGGKFCFKSLNFLILLVFYGIYDILFKFIQALLQLTQSFFKGTSHATENFFDFTSDRSTTRAFYLSYYGPNRLSDVPLVILIECNESTWEIND
jgi:hypothetical protein